MSSPLEAISLFSERSLLPMGIYKELSALAKQRAFSVAGVAHLDVLQMVFDLLGEALNAGPEASNFDDIKANIADTLEAEWGGEIPGRVETIFRTNMQSAYSAGRAAIMADPDVMEDRPYWLFDSVVDSRRTPICEAMHGVCRPANDPGWNGLYPPNHFGCRSVISTLTEEEAKAHGISAGFPHYVAAPGFGQMPQELAIATGSLPERNYDPAIARLIER